MREQTERLIEIERHFGKPIPKVYRSYLESHSEMLRGDGLLLYGTDYIVERNTTLGVQEYVEEFLGIGDDSGGRVIVIRFADEAATPYIVDGGSLVANMPPSFLEPLATSWSDWESKGFPLDG